MFQRHPGSILVLAVLGAGLLVASSPGAMAAERAERMLAGIQVGRKYTPILKKYGDPTLIIAVPGLGITGLTGQGGITGRTGSGTPGMPGGGQGMPGGGMPGMMGPGGGMGRPGMGGGMPGMMGGGSPGMMGGGGMPGMGGGMPGMMGGGAPGGGGDANLPRGGRGPGMGMMGGGGGMPGMMGGGSPGMMGGGGMPGMGMMGRGPMQGGGGALPPVTGGTPTLGGIGAIGGAGVGQQQVVRWIYEFKNVVLEFTIDDSDGTVLQITAIGEKWPQARTKRGITLGNTYKEVIAKHGFPESHSGVGVIIMNYQEKQHCAMVLLDNKVIAITVAVVQ